MSTFGSKRERGPKRKLHNGDLRHLNIHITKVDQLKDTEMSRTRWYKQYLKNNGQKTWRYESAEDKVKILLKETERGTHCFDLTKCQVLRRKQYAPLVLRSRLFIGHLTSSKGLSFHSTSRVLLLSGCTVSCHGLCGVQSLTNLPPCPTSSVTNAFLHSQFTF
jgi:hypothetical protein